MSLSDYGRLWRLDVAFRHVGETLGRTEWEVLGKFGARAEELRGEVCCNMRCVALSINILRPDKRQKFPERSATESYIVQNFGEGFLSSFMYTRVFHPCRDEKRRCAGEFLGVTSPHRRKLELWPIVKP
jgi:hypothetical protein